MRVHYVTILFPYPGETFAGSDVRALLAEGAEVEVHSLRPRHPSNDDLVARWGLQRVRLTHSGLDDALAGLKIALRRPRLFLEAVRLAMGTLGRPVMFFKTLAILPRTLTIFERVEQEQPDVLHLFWGHYPAFIARLVQERLPDTATSIFLGAYDLDWGYPLSRPAALNAHLVWTHSQANLPDLEALGIDPRRVRVAYRGLDLARLPEPVAKVEGRIVSAGRLIASKGMDRVLRVFHEVSLNHPAATLVIMGDGPERTNLERLAGRLGISDRVEFSGHVDHDQVLAELNRAEVMLFLSEKPSERLPNAVKEAMACGCYCVAYGTPGMDELIPDESYGAVTSSSEPQVIAPHVNRALDDRELRLQVAENARRYVRDNFDNRVTMRRYLDEWRLASGLSARAVTSGAAVPASGGTP